MESKLLNRFLRYVKIDTQSEENSTTTPSTQNQLIFGDMLVEELNQMGLENVDFSSEGYVYACLPANVEGNFPAIGFIAHIDTSPEYSGKNVNPMIIENYDGKDIILNEKDNIILPVKYFPEIIKYKGQTIITTDGNTLLGADDKAGIAEIMEVLNILKDNPQIKHGDIKIAFTPDEEIGRGVDNFDINKFGADFAYTIDGGEVGEIQYENFNAAEANIKIKGINVHPGSAFNKMVNSIQLAMEINNILPPKQRPEHTKNYEGFFHLMEFEGTVEKTTMKYLIRNHDREIFEEMKKLLGDTEETINAKYGEGTVKIQITDNYYNMARKIEPVIHVVDLAKTAIYQSNIEPIVCPIRGGTDGAALSFRGLPTPNLFTGGHNFHSKYEYISLQSMEKAVEVILKIIENNVA